MKSNLKKTIKKELSVLSESQILLTENPNARNVLTVFCDGSHAQPVQVNNAMNDCDVLYPNVPHFANAPQNCQCSPPMIGSFFQNMTIAGQAPQLGDVFNFNDQLNGITGFPGGISMLNNNTAFFNGWFGDHVVVEVMAAATQSSQVDYPPAPPCIPGMLCPTGDYHMWTECSGFIGGPSQSMTWSGLPGYVSGADLSNSQIFYDWIDTTIGPINPGDVVKIDLSANNQNYTLCLQYDGLTNNVTPVTPWNSPLTILSVHPDCNDCTYIVTQGTEGVRSCCDPTIEYTLTDDPNIGATLALIGATIGDGFISSLLINPGPNQTDIPLTCWEVIANSTGPLATIGSGYPPQPNGCGGLPNVPSPLGTSCCEPEPELFCCSFAGPPCFPVATAQECDFGIAYPDLPTCQANCGDPEERGCLDPMALNYNQCCPNTPGCFPLLPDPECCRYEQGDHKGCMDPAALNYMTCCDPNIPNCVPTANSPECCKYDGGGEDKGCMDPAAINYNVCCNGDPNCTVVGPNPECCKYEGEPDPCKLNPKDCWFCTHGDIDTSDWQDPMAIVNANGGCIQFISTNSSFASSYSGQMFTTKIDCENQTECRPSDEMIQCQCCEGGYAQSMATPVPANPGCSVLNGGGLYNCNPAGSPINCGDHDRPIELSEEIKRYKQLL